MLAALAAGVGLFGASLLRTEGRSPDAEGAAPSKGGTCSARTRSGGPCSRAAEPGSDRCWQHR